MLFRRKAYREILRWSEGSSDTALLLTGARQVGKSTLVRQLGETEYEVFVEVNLYNDATARQALSEAKDATELISRISLLSSHPLVEGHTLIFIDEIQELPDIITMAKFLVEDGRFRYAFSGSLLGTHLKRVRSYPVGYVTEIKMYPMDFEEFCWALEVSDEAMETVRTSVRHLQPVPEFLHDAFNNYFRIYLVVGGMPEAVQVYRETKGDLATVIGFLKQLVEAYRHDITKYAGRRALNVEEIFNQLPIQLDKDSRRFMLNSVDPDARYQSFRQDFVWLTTAGVALKCDRVTDPKAPLKSTARPGTFKLYESDTGMLVSRYPETLAQAVIYDDRSVNQGAVFENAVAQQLVAMDYPLFYYMNRKRGEVDFITEGPAGEVVPIEVKSGGSPRAHAALNQLLESPEYGISLSLVFSRLNVECKGKLVYLPWYAVSYMGEVLKPVGTLPKVKLPKI